MERSLTGQEIIFTSSFLRFTGAVQVHELRPLKPYKCLCFECHFVKTYGLYPAYLAPPRKLPKGQNSQKLQIHKN